jgi:hypothetical protein
MSQEQSASNNRKRLNPRSSPLVSIVFMIGTLLGVALNLRMASLGLGENVFGLIVWLSMGLMAVGFVPGIRRWRLGRLATRVSCIAIGCYLAYILWAVATYKDT